MINWAAFSWEAFATLLTGVSAVIAALIIGYRQIGLVARQVDLQAQQARLGEEAAARDHALKQQTLRLQLLDRRASLVEEIRRIWVQWMQDATLNDEDWVALRSVLHQAQLLYPKAIVDDIDAALRNLMLQKTHQDRASQYHSSGRADKAKEHLEKSFSADDKVVEVMESLLERVIAASRVID
jgi:hypothetical protein